MAQTAIETKGKPAGPPPVPPLATRQAAPAARPAAEPKLAELGAKRKALDAAIAQITKDFGKGAVMMLGDKNAAFDVEAAPTGLLGVDLALGVGGLPRGRIIEIYGPESGGKTTLSLQAVAAVQKGGGAIVVKGRNAQNKRAVFQAVFVPKAPSKFKYAGPRLRGRKSSKGFSMLDLLNDLWGFMRVRKKFWIAPILLVLLVLGALLVFGQSSAMAPFIYTLF